MENVQFWYEGKALLLRGGLHRIIIRAEVIWMYRKIMVGRWIFEEDNIVSVQFLPICPRVNEETTWRLLLLFDLQMSLMPDMIIILGGNRVGENNGGTTE